MRINNDNTSGTGAVTLSTSSSGRGAQWAIIPTDDGGYILMASAVAANSDGDITKVLFLPSNSASGGTVGQYTYVDDTNEQDEWYIGRRIGMKLYICIIFLFMLSIIFVSCEETTSSISNETEFQTESETKEEVVTKYESYLSISPDEWERLSDFYHGQEITAVKIYAYAGVPSESITDILKKDIGSAICYAVWKNSEEPIEKLCVDEDGMSRTIHGYTVDNSCFADFKYVNSTIDLLDTQCFLYEVISFDGEWAHTGTVNYLITDRGVFVKYYSDPKAEALVFAEDEYRTMAAAYENFCREDLEKEREPMLIAPLYSIQFHDFIKDEALLEKYSKS